MTTTTTSFATAKDVSSAITSLGFQASADTLGAISRNCREAFLEHLSKCVAGQDPDGANAKIIGNLIRCLSPDMLNRLKTVTPDVTIDMVAPVAKATPAKLLSAIDAAINPQHDRHNAAKEYLVTVFAPSPACATAQGSYAPTSNGDNAPAQEQSSRAPRHEPETATTETAGGKKYNSCHVYGSTYALCFNAGEWEGKRGVMVDAAVSSGPKAYDWKNATHIWLDTNEVGAVLAVFRRWRKSVEFGSHGAQNDKSFSIEFQGQHFFAKVSARKANVHPARAVKIMPTDATAVSILFLTQLTESYPAIPLNELLATVRATHDLTNAAAA